MVLLTLQPAVDRLNCRLAMLLCSLALILRMLKASLLVFLETVLKLF
jgi:hypothetical protein